MKDKQSPSSAKKFHLGAVLSARCPACLQGKVNRSFLQFHRRCPKCGYDFYPESGFYLGAVMISFLVTAILTVPPMIVLKVLNVDIEIIIMFPFLEFLILGGLLMFYSKILWLHLEYQMSKKLDSEP